MKQELSYLFGTTIYTFRIWVSSFKKIIADDVNVMLVDDILNDDDADANDDDMDVGELHFQNEVK